MQIILLHKLCYAFYLITACIIRVYRVYTVHCTIYILFKNLCNQVHCTFNSQQYVFYPVHFMYKLLNNKKYLHITLSSQMVKLNTKDLRVTHEALHNMLLHMHTLIQYGIMYTCSCYHNTQCVFDIQNCWVFVNSVVFENMIYIIHHLDSISGYIKLQYMTS